MACPSLSQTTASHLSRQIRIQAFLVPDEFSNLCVSIIGEEPPGALV